ncbi:hypothetical protein IU459_32875 [Nocardia amamiensis]|uniref:DUF222 domain-containing protein n=1 Tax=Nocardia amamiensis TaxID=404578 RepID=A0ABS0D1K9_9NOCA|nr:hypothetical protein [Nocardia amamiensis]MBF6302300.1 hypothetical protein [Nocardia amamiensis]
MPPPVRKLGGKNKGGADSQQPQTLEQGATPPVSPLRDAEWSRDIAKGQQAAGVETITAQPATPAEVAAGPHAPTQAPVPASLAGIIPDHYEQPDATGDLTAKERDDLAACEAALDVARVAFYIAGKALRVIRDARLYRATHATFDDYVSDRWGMRRANAHRLIEAAPIAEPIVMSPMGDKINERQARELVPLSKHHSEQAAADLYLALAQQVAAANGKGPKITGELVRQAAEATLAELPPGSEWNRETAAEVARTVLAQVTGQAPTEEAADDDAEPHSWFEAETGRIASLADRVAKRADKHPAEAKAFAAALMAHARRIEKAVSKSAQ